MKNIKYTFPPPSPPYPSQKPHERPLTYTYLRSPIFPSWGIGRQQAKFFQPALSWASLSCCSQVRPILFMPASRSRRQVLLGHPSFFSLGDPSEGLSCGVLAGLRNMLPIDFQRRFKISSSADF